MIIYQVFWRHKENRDTHYGYVRANSRDHAYDIMSGKLADGYIVTAVYEARVNNRFSRF